MHLPLQPILANGINLPLLLILGSAILLPLLLFQVITEAWILSRLWKTPFRPLTRLTLRANLWSVLAGIPTKFLNAFIAYHLIPADLPSAFIAYPRVAILTAFTYFIVTVLTEAAVTKQWLHHPNNQPILKPILLANLATYLVLAPLYYVVARPTTDPMHYTQNVQWTQRPDTRIVFTHPETHALQTLTLNSPQPQTLVTNPVLDYLVSTNLETILYRTTNGLLTLQHQHHTYPIWQTSQRFFMDQIAFSPSATRVAYISHSTNSILTITNLIAHTQVTLQVDTDAYNTPSLAWSPSEDTLYFRPSPTNNVSQIQLSPSGIPLLSPLIDTDPTTLECYGRTNDKGRYFGGQNWGHSFSEDTYGTLRAKAFAGLDSSLTIYTTDPHYERILHISFNPGLLHFSAIPMNEVAIITRHQEILLQAGQHLCLISVPNKTLGNISPGTLPIVLHLPRYKKTI